MSKTQERKTLLGKICFFFLQDTVKRETTFRVKNLTQRWTQSGLFFQGRFFRFFKKDRWEIRCLSPSLAILCLQKRYCSSAFVYWEVSFIEELIHRRFLLQQPLSRSTRIRSSSRQYLFISSGKSVLLLRLSATCPQEKSSHKKDHTYLTEEYFTCLLKNLSQSGHL